MRQARRGHATTLYGETHGLKPSQIKRLHLLARRKIKGDEVITPELARDLAHLSRELGRQLGLLIERSGTLYGLIIGNEKEVLIPDLSAFPFGQRALRGARPLRGVRLVHTHLKNEPLTQDDLSDLALLRLDLILAIGVMQNGDPGSLYLAHLMPPNPEGKIVEIWNPTPLYRLDLPVKRFLTDLEAEWEGKKKTHITEQLKERAVLISASLAPKSIQEDAISELSELAESANLQPIHAVIQRPRQLHPKYLLGAGKLKEVVMKALQEQADLLVFDQNLTPLQVKAIGEVTEMKVLDRTQLILDIFARRAVTREAKVQVELAQLRYRLPRLAERSTALSRLTGGIGGRGPGETRLEVDRRRARDRIARLSREMEALGQAREQRRAMRVRHQIPILSIIGYTNAGKSTLLNTLTRSHVQTEDLLFATLDTTTRRLRLPREREVIITDTVGFIQSLPPDLMGAFRSTLDELKDAHLLIHLVDISHPQMQRHIETVESILGDLKLEQTPRLLVFNKLDKVESPVARNLCERYQATGISAPDETSLRPLLDAIEQYVMGKHPAGC